MPITVFPTEPAHLFTPGGIIAWQSDFVGPIASDASYTVTLLSDAAEGSAVWSSGLSAHQLKTGQLQLLGNRNSTQSDTQGPWPVDGNDVRVIVELIEGGSTIDSGAGVFKWSDSAGIGAQISDREQTGGGGLTPVEAGQLQDSAEATNPVLNDRLGLPHIVPLGDTWPFPLPSLFGNEPGDMLLTGRGILDAPVHDPILTIFGIELIGEVIPQGFGRRDGFAVKFTQRLGQFLLVVPGNLAHQDDMFIAEYELFLDRFTWLFPTRQVVRVAYMITPGVTIRARWVSVAP